uniref:UV excision repair protein RAD23 n=2 Tax=Mesocestoides corti TaxID=53468 RepID=A0A5K3F4I5_MESCO
MHLTFKTLKQQTFFLDANESDLVGDVKENIKKSKPEDYGGSQLKLIYSGKVMEDDKTLGHYGVTEKGFIVVMAQIVKQPKESNLEPIKKIPSSTAPAASETPEAASSTKENPPSQAPASSEPTATMDASLSSGGNALLTGDKLEEAIKNIVEMGFERDQVLQALRLSFNNPDRAVEYLVSGSMPATVSEQPPAQHQAPTATVPQQPPTSESGVSRDTTNEPGTGANPMQLLTQLPQFQQLRALRGNPQLLTQYIQQLSTSNPELLRLIQANEQAFLDFINADDDVTNPEGEQPQPLPHHIIRLTEQEKSAIDRLKALGFPEDDVIQAYFACDKDEELAANFLLSENQDDAV